MPETPEVILPHFTPEEVEALRVENERRAQGMKIGLNASDERVRDAIQREMFWNGQIACLVRQGYSPDTDEMQHAWEELSHALFTQGRIDEALSLSKNPERRAWYTMIQEAILKPDDEECDCETPDHVIGEFLSAKHGKMVPIKQCPECKVMSAG